MVKLKNIVIKDYTIECDIYPEDSLQAGHISVDINSRELICFDLPKGFEWCRNHVNHAKYNLTKFIEEDDIPKEKLVMWH